LTIRQLLITAAVAAAVTLVAIFTIDAPIARLFLARDLGPITPVLDHGLHHLDKVSAMMWPKGLLVTASIVLGGALWWWKRGVGRGLLILGLTHAVARTLGSELKSVFGRLRPSDAAARGDLDTTFWLDGISFPSGHVGHYAALAFVVAYLFPRARIPAFVVLGLVVLARVSVAAHFVSDCAGSIALAALAVAAFAAMLPTQPRPPAPAPGR
jgi:membrane-associated phospholipid phosphatase